MLKELVERFDNNRDNIKSALRNKLPDSYEELVKLLVEHITTDDYEDYALDPGRIHRIDDGDYQGTLVFVIAEKGYQPYKYYYTMVSYGSCSGCDTLYSILSESYDEVTEGQVEQMFTLALHMLQKLRPMYGD